MRQIADDPAAFIGAAVARVALSHVCDVWAPGQQIPLADGSPQDLPPTLIYRGLPCFYHFTDNVDDPVVGVGRFKRASIFTTDTIQFPMYLTDQAGRKTQVVIPDSAMFVNRSPRDIDPQSRGLFHTGQGIPKIIAGSRLVPVNQQFIMIAVEPHPDQTVADCYGNLPGDELA